MYLLYHLYLRKICSTEDMPYKSLAAIYTSVANIDNLPSHKSDIELNFYVERNKHTLMVPVYFCIRIRVVSSGRFFYRFA